MTYMTKWWLKSNAEKEMPHTPVKVEITECSGELNNIRSDGNNEEYTKEIDDIFLTLQLENEEDNYEWDPETEKGIQTTELKYLKIYFTQSDVEELLAILSLKLNLN